MSEVLLIEEAGDRAIDRVHQLLTLMLLGFEDGEARARAMRAADPERIVDPVASACFDEARELLLRAAAPAGQPRANVFAALAALDMAASREPECYGLAHQALRRILFAALDDTVALELANAQREDARVEPLTPERLAN